LTVDAMYLVNLFYTSY